VVLVQKGHMKRPSEYYTCFLSSPGLRDPFGTIFTRSWILNPESAQLAGQVRAKRSLINLGSIQQGDTPFKRILELPSLMRTYQGLFADKKEAMFLLWV
jgi:hypothetical protein